MDSVGTTFNSIERSNLSQILFGLKRQDIKNLVLKDHLLALNIYNSWMKIFINLLSIGYLFGRGFTCYLYHFFFP